MHLGNKYLLERTDTKYKDGVQLGDNEYLEITINSNIDTTLALNMLPTNNELYFNLIKKTHFYSLLAILLLACQNL